MELIANYILMLAGAVCAFLLILVLLPQKQSKTSDMDNNTAVKRNQIK